jgi:short subunit dehydrogenase-like uncharacterized protein
MEVAVTARIVVFGATGFTGRLVARSLVRLGARPTLAGRDRGRLDQLAAELGGLHTAVAESSSPASVRELVGAGDVLVTTVGPYLIHGQAAVRAAVDAGAAYLDATGEPAFVREVFERHGPLAAGRSGLLPAFGYDFVPGNLAGALALAEAGGSGGAPSRLDIGYFVTGRAAGAVASSGTTASGARMAFEPSFAWRDGRLISERIARSARSFTVEGRRLQAVSFGGSEHLTMPRLAPGLRDVSVNLGLFGPRIRRIQVAAAAAAIIGHLPGVGAAARAAAGRLGRRSGEGPDLTVRQGARSHAIAIAYDAAQRPLAEVHLAGPDPYTLTGDLLAWGAYRAAEAGLHGTGALGPVDGFGLAELTDGAAAAGLTRVTADLP